MLRSEIEGRARVGGFLCDSSVVRWDGTGICAGDGRFEEILDVCMVNLYKEASLAAQVTTEREINGIGGNDSRIAADKDVTIE